VRVLQRMAQFIQENPSITVKELARKLGYSEEKSVYYWLEKAKFYGIKNFKRAVLTGQFPITRTKGYQEPRRPTGKLKEAKHDRYGELPVRWIRGFGPKGELQLSSGQSLAHHLSPGTEGGEILAYRLESAEYEPTLTAGDIVLIDPATGPSDGDWVFARFPDGRHGIRLFYRAGDHVLLVHPGQTADVIKSTGNRTRVVGRVFRILRHV